MQPLQADVHPAEALGGLRTPPGDQGYLWAAAPAASGDRVPGTRLPGLFSPPRQTGALGHASHVYAGLS